MNLNWTAFENLIDPKTFTGALILAIGVFIVAWIACAVTTRMIHRANLVMGKLRRKVDETVVGYVVRIKNLLIFLTSAFLYATLVSSLRALVGTMMAGAGITALVVGFAAKSTLANHIAGLSLALYRPIRIGDKVHVDGEFSMVEDITLRHTIVRTWQHKRLIIPNAKLDEMTLTNFSIFDPRIKCTIEMGVSYDTDIDLARRLVLDEANQCPYRDPAEEETPYVRVISHEDFPLGFGCMCG